MIYGRRLKSRFKKSSQAGASFPAVTDTLTLRVQAALPSPPPAPPPLGWGWPGLEGGGRRGAGTRGLSPTPSSRRNSGRELLEAGGQWGNGERDRVRPQEGRKKVGFGLILQRDNRACWLRSVLPAHPQPNNLGGIVQK